MRCFRPIIPFGNHLLALRERVDGFCHDLEWVLAHCLHLEIYHVFTSILRHPSETLDPHLKEHNMPQAPLERLSVQEIDYLLRGFPEAAVSSAQELRRRFDEQVLEDCLFGLLSFYFPKDSEPVEIEQRPVARLREDLGLDSLALAEAMFKVEECCSMCMSTMLNLRGGYPERCPGHVDGQVGCGG